MKPILYHGRALLVLCLAGLLAACASTPRVSVEADPRADFSAYRTYAFHSPLAIEDRGYETPISETAKAAVRAQLDSRGYLYETENPDLWVNVNGWLERRTEVTSVPVADYGTYYGYRGYYAAPYWSTRTHVSEYTEGTLNVDLVDRAGNRLVWEGVAVGRVPSSLAPDQRNQRIETAIAEIFAQYPHRAGTASPVQ